MHYIQYHEKYCKKISSSLCEKELFLCAFERNCKSPVAEVNIVIDRLAVRPQKEQKWGRAIDARRQSV